MATSMPAACPLCEGTHRLMTFPNGIAEEVNCPMCTGAKTSPGMPRPTVVPGQTPQPAADLNFEDTLETPAIPPSSKVPEDLFVWVKDEAGVEHCVQAELVEE